MDLGEREGREEPGRVDGGAGNSWDVRSERLGE